MSMIKIKPKHLVVAISLALIALFVLPQVLADQPGARSVSGTSITETIGVGGTNATASFQVRLLEGSDAVHESDHIFEALAGLPGVGKAVLDTETLELTVAYDGAAGEAPIRERLVQAGYLVPTREDAVAAQILEDRSLPRIEIGDDGKGFDPHLVFAEAGMPIEIEFSAGQDCRTTVKFPQLGIEQVIAEGGTVSLPALEPGEYYILCSGDALEGTLFVE